MAVNVLLEMERIMAEQNYVELRHVNKKYKDFQASDDINFGIGKGKLIGLLGPSGSGKTTILRMLAGLEHADSGEIIIDGRVVNDVPASERGIGFVFQNFNLFPHYSVLKNIMDAPLHVQKRDKAEVQAEAAELLRKMGLSDKGDAYPYQLSGGQQQRVSIARALATNPKVLFFDEPTSALDPELTGDILKTIRSLAAERKTMVIVTHEIEFARNVADKVVFMADGVIIEEGPPEQVIGNPKNERTRMFLNKLSR